MTLISVTHSWLVAWAALWWPQPVHPTWNGDLKSYMCSQAFAANLVPLVTGLASCIVRGSWVCVGEGYV